MKNNYKLVLSFIGVCFFFLGFSLGVNSFLIPVLKLGLDISSSESYLLLAASFTPFLIFGYPAGMMIKKAGYRLTMVFSFMLFALGFYVFSIANTLIVFLLSAFVSGAANSFLQTAVNPYTAILGPEESAAKRISMMGICNKIGMAVSPLFLSVIISKDIKEIAVTDLSLPFTIIIFTMAVLALVMYVAPIPEIDMKGEKKEQSVDNEGNVWKYSSFVMGAVSLFLYVGAETISLSTMVDYSTELGIFDKRTIFGELNFGELSSFIPSLGLVIGYLAGIALIPKYISTSQALKICSLIAIVGTLFVAFSPAGMSIYFIFLMSLGCSLMWPAIYPLAIEGLGRLTEKGASFLTMAIAGGAVIPLAFSYFKDVLCMQWAYLICLPCFMFIYYYSVRKRA